MIWREVLEIRIPGEPRGQGRPRSTVREGRAHVYEGKDDRDWKASARDHMVHQWGDRALLDGVVGVSIVAFFSLPRSRHRKTKPRPAEMRTQSPDLDNIVKAVKDAAKGVLWVDDKQVAKLSAEKWTAAQGSPAFTVVRVFAPDDV